MAESGCANCAWRQKYDQNQTSFLGKLWKWHIKFCPGWKQYLSSLDENERVNIEAKYK